MIPSPEKIQRIAELRIKAANGSLTDDEVKEAITFLRGERLAMAPSPTRTRKQKPEDIDVGGLLGELGIG